MMTDQHTKAKPVPIQDPEHIRQGVRRLQQSNSDNCAILAVGSLDRVSEYFPDPQGAGISFFSFDEVSGELAFVKSIKTVDNPAFMNFNANSNMLYVVSEIIDWNEGLVSAYKYSEQDLSLEYINMQPTLGNVTAHVDVHPNGGFLVTSNYSIGPLTDQPGQAFAVYPILSEGLGEGLSEGGISAFVASRKHSFTGPNAERQERSHVHCATFSHDGDFLIVAEFGGDKIAVYPFNSKSGKLDEPKWFDACTPGAGPRHLCFHPNHKLLYVSNELGGSVAAYCYDSENGSLKLTDYSSVLPDKFVGTPSTAEIAVHPKGQFAFASDRTNNSIAVIELREEGCKLNLTDVVSTGGKTPRHFTISPNGNWLIVGNQDTNTLAVMKFDDESGTLSKPQHIIDCGTPFCVKFLI